MTVAADASWRAMFNESAGRMTERDLMVKLPMVLARHGYFIERGESFQQGFSFETSWRMRSAYPEELERGARAARTRLRFRALQSGAMYSVRIQVESMMEVSRGQWVRSPGGDAFQSYARELTREIRAELASGMRTY